MPKKRTSKPKRRSYRRRISRAIRRRVPKRISILTAIPIAHKAILEPILGDGGRWGAKKMYETTNGNIGDAALEGLNIAMENFTGFSIKGGDAGKWYPMTMLGTYLEIGAGVLGHKLANKFGVNRQIHKVPFIGKKLEL